MPIIVTLFIVVVVSLSCAVFRLYLMRAKTASRPPAPLQPKRFKTAPSFGPQRALPGFGALPAGSADKLRVHSVGHYTYLESRTSPLSEDSEEAAAATRLVRALREVGGGGGGGQKEDSRVLVECPPSCDGHGGGGGGGGGAPVVSLQQHRHHPLA